MIDVSSIKQWFSEIRSRPLELLIGASIFFVAAMGGAVGHVASTALAIMFLVCLAYIHRWPHYWQTISRSERLVLIGFALFALSGLLAYINVDDKQEFIRHMGRYIRFFLIMPVYLVLSRPEFRLYRYLLAGAIVSGPLYLVFTLISTSGGDGIPASWHYHHIVFGAAAMLNAVLMIAVLAAGKTGRWMKTLLIISILCALYASIMSTARGAWIVLPACLAIVLYLAVKTGDIKLKTLLLSLLMLFVIAAVSPVSDVIERRYDEAVSEIEKFASGEQFATSVGGRLAMWHVALMVWKDHPVIGTGPGDYDEELMSRQQQGLYRNIEVHASIHNIYLQALATTGTIGFIALCAGLLFWPLRHFMQGDLAHRSTARLGGIMCILAFAVFGLTESWILRAPLISLYLVYIVTLSRTVAGRSTAS